MEAKLILRDLAGVVGRGHRSFLRKQLHAAWPPGLSVKFRKFSYNFVSFFPFLNKTVFALVIFLDVISKWLRGNELISRHSQVTSLEIIHFKIFFF